MIQSVQLALEEHWWCIFEWVHLDVNLHQSEHLVSSPLTRKLTLQRGDHRRWERLNGRPEGNLIPLKGLPTSLLMVRYFSNWHLFVSLFCSMVTNVLQFKFSPCYIDHGEPCVAIARLLVFSFPHRREAEPSSWGANDRFDSWARELVSLWTMVLWRDGNGWLSLIVPGPGRPWLASCGPAAVNTTTRTCLQGARTCLSDDKRWTPNPSWQ